MVNKHYCPQAFTITLEKAEKKQKEEEDPYHSGFLKENEEEMVLGKIRKISLIPKFIPIFGITIPKNIPNFRIMAIFQRFHLSSSPISWGQYQF